MYGVSEDLMQRMEKRIKEKLYREMLEEHHRRNQNENMQTKPSFNPRFRTEPDYHQSTYRRNKMEENNRQNPYLIGQESTFLPLIPSKRKSIDSDRQQKRKANPQYQTNQEQVNCRERRLSREERPSKRRASTSAVLEQERAFGKEAEDSEQQKTEEYLNQCEQIISNLRQLNRKNKERVARRQNKYEVEHDFKYSPKIKSFRSRNFERKPNQYTPKFGSFDFANSISNHLKDTELTSNSWGSSPRPLQATYNSEFNDSASLDCSEKESPNDRNISPRVRIQDLKMKSCNQQQNTRALGRQNLRRLSPIRDSRSDSAGKNGDIKEEEENDNQCETEENEERQAKSNNCLPKHNTKQLPKQDKRQKAILKYLKKARLRGNLLYQKVESRKTQTYPHINQQPNTDPPKIEVTQG